MSHYCHVVWPNSHYGTIHLYGHTHGTLTVPWRAIDVGVDKWNFTPVSCDEIIAKFGPDNGEYRDFQYKLGEIK